eukprot:762637-Hanusia_phi.AAC.1
MKASSPLNHLNSLIDWRERGGAGAGADGGGGRSWRKRNVLEEEEKEKRDVDRCMPSKDFGFLGIRQCGVTS